MTTPRAIARLAALRGFAWSDEAAPTTTGDCPVLAPNGADLGRLDVAAVAETEDDSDDSDGFTLFDAIVPLSDEERTSLFEQLEDTELAALTEILSAADFDLAEVVAEHFDIGSEKVLAWLPRPTEPLLRASRRARVELLDALRTKYVADEREVSPLAARQLEKIRALRGRLFNDSIRLAAAEARKYRRHLSFESALLAACRGLVIALDRFEPTRGTKFSTFAVWWTRHSVTRERMDRGNALRVPVRVSEKLSLFIGRERELWRGRGERPSAETVLESLEPGRRAAPHQMEHLRPVLQAHLEHEEYLFPPLAEGIIDATVLPPFEGGETAHWIAAVLDELEASFNALSDKRVETMREILRGRLAVARSEPKTLRELGDEFGVSRERIRQIQNKALGKLKLDGPADDANPWDWRSTSDRVR